MQVRAMPHGGGQCQTASDLDALLYGLLYFRPRNRWGVTPRDAYDTTPSRPSLADSNLRLAHPCCHRMQRTTTSIPVSRTTVRPGQAPFRGGLSCLRGLIVVLAFAPDVPRLRDQCRLTSPIAYRTHASQDRRQSSRSEPKCSVCTASLRGRRARQPKRSRSGVSANSSTGPTQSQAIGRTPAGLRPGRRETARRRTTPIRPRRLRRLPPTTRSG